MEIDQQEVRRLYVDEKLSQRQTAERLGLESKYPVRKVIENSDIASRNRGAKSKNAKWKDKEILFQLYWEENLSSREIGERFGIASRTVISEMERLDIPRRAPMRKRQNRVKYRTNQNGYTEWKGFDEYFLVHRLAAIAWFGVDEVAGKDVHHKSNIPWDNRESNLEVMTRSEHMEMHKQSQTEYPNLDNQ